MVDNIAETKAKKRQYVVIFETEDSVFCDRICDSYYEAFGYAMDRIYEEKADYNADGDIFDISDPYELDGDAGYGINVEFCAKGDELNIEFVYILNYDSRQK